MSWSKQSNALAKKFCENQYGERDPGLSVQAEISLWSWLFYWQILILPVIHKIDVKDLNTFSNYTVSIYLGLFTLFIFILLYICIFISHTKSFFRKSVQSLSHVWLFVTPWTAACQASLSITNSWTLLKFMSIESVIPSNHVILCHPLLLLPSILANIRVFSNESGLCIKWPKYCSFSFSISPSNEYSGLISFRIDWLDLPAVQGTLKCFLWYHSSKASILWHSAFFIVQLSHP